MPPATQAPRKKKDTLDTLQPAPQPQVRRTEQAGNEVEKMKIQAGRVGVPPKIRNMAAQNGPPRPGAGKASMRVQDIGGKPTKDFADTAVACMNSMSVKSTLLSSASSSSVSKAKANPSGLSTSSARKKNIRIAARAKAATKERGPEKNQTTIASCATSPVLKHPKSIPAAEPKEGKNKNSGCKKKTNASETQSGSRSMRNTPALPAPVPDEDSDEHANKITDTEDEEDENTILLAAKWRGLMTEKQLSQHHSLSQNRPEREHQEQVCGRSSLWSRLFWQTSSVDKAPTTQTHAMQKEEESESNSKSLSSSTSSKCVLSAGEDKNGDFEQIRSALLVPQENNSTTSCLPDKEDNSSTSKTTLVSTSRPGEDSGNEASQSNGIFPSNEPATPSRSASKRAEPEGTRSATPKRILVLSGVLVVATGSVSFLVWRCTAGWPQIAAWTTSQERTSVQFSAASLELDPLSRTVKDTAQAGGSLILANGAKIGTDVTGRQTGGMGITSVAAESSMFQLGAQQGGEGLMGGLTNCPEGGCLEQFLPKNSHEVWFENVLFEKQAQELVELDPTHPLCGAYFFDVHGAIPLSDSNVFTVPSSRRGGTDFNLVLASLPGHVFRNAAEAHITQVASTVVGGLTRDWNNSNGDDSFAGADSYAQRIARSLNTHFGDSDQFVNDITTRNEQYHRQVRPALYAFINERLHAHAPGSPWFWHVATEGEKPDEHLAIAKNEGKLCVYRWKRNKSSDAVQPVKIACGPSGVLPSIHGRSSSVHLKGFTLAQAVTWVQSTPDICERHRRTLISPHCRSYDVSPSDSSSGGTTASRNLQNQHRAAATRQTSIENYVAQYSARSGPVNQNPAITTLALAIAEIFVWLPSRRPGTGRDDGTAVVNFAYDTHESDKLCDDPGLPFVTFRAQRNEGADSALCFPSGEIKLQALQALGEATDTVRRACEATARQRQVSLDLISKEGRQDLDYLWNISPPLANGQKKELFTKLVSQHPDIKNSNQQLFYQWLRR
ncbi:unnamed protein product [Amoebophrya sp. A120]|nr:unnamed protein product [Amoebophrya sp. A120]|eukprot:GSA120T00009010001.1